MNGTEVNPRYSENALKEKAFLQELNKKPPLQKFFGYCKLSGPGFMNAAFTLGAGSFASSVTLGAAYGYDMLWIPLYSFALGLFMLALATRFVTASEISVIKAQDKFHGKFSEALPPDSWPASSHRSFITSASTPWAQTLLPPCSRW